MNGNDHYRTGNDGYWQMAQVSPGASLIYPLYPQLDPHEFLILQN